MIDSDRYGWGMTKTESSGIQHTCMKENMLVALKNVTCIFQYFGQHFMHIHVHDFVLC